MHKLIKYLFTKVNFFDNFKTRYYLRKNGRGKKIVGFYSQFPPFYNGASMFASEFIKKVSLDESLKFIAVPWKNRFQKNLFKNVLFTSDKKIFDVIVFFLSGRNIEKFSHCIKKICWETIHFDYGKNHSELELFKSLKNSDLVLATTKFGLNVFKKAGFKNVEYLPLGVDTTIYRFDFEKKKKVIFVGRSHYYKGLAPFLDSIPLVLEKIPDALFYVHSPLDINGPFLDEIFNKFVELKKSYPENFFYNTEWVSFENLRKNFFDASILVFPSNNEGFGLPLIEAMACGAVCIASNASPMNEIVVNGKTGFCLKLFKQKKYHDFLFPKAEGIAEKTVLLLKNDGLRTKMAKNARLKVEKEYDLNKIIFKLINFINKLRD